MSSRFCLTFPRQVLWGHSPPPQGSERQLQKSAITSENQQILAGMCLSPACRLCGTGAVPVSLLEKHLAQAAGVDQDVLDDNFIQILSNNDTYMAV